MTTEHTSEAQASYPDDRDSGLPEGITLALRTAFDRGRASMVETVTTADELDALPVGTVTRSVDASGLVIVAEKEPPEFYRDPESWAWAGMLGQQRPPLPARVLFRPSPEEETP